MQFDLSRLRRGEWIAGGGAVVLAAAMFLLPWYGLESPLGPTAATLGQPTSWDGWHGLTNLRWLVLVTILVALCARMAADDPARAVAAGHVRCDLDGASAS